MEKYQQTNRTSIRSLKPSSATMIKIRQQSSAAPSFHAQILIMIMRPFAVCELALLRWVNRSMMLKVVGGRPDTLQACYRHGSAIGAMGFIVNLAAKRARLVYKSRVLGVCKRCTGSCHVPRLGCFHISVSPYKVNRSIQYKAFGLLLPMVFRMFHV